MQTSIVVITWNSLEFVKQTLPKLLNLKNIHELIVVDNGSTDGTSEYIQKLNNKKIQLIKNTENLGASKARNQGAKIATGKYILFLDDDMLVENTEIISDLEKYYENLDNPAFVMPFFVDKEEIENGYTRSYGTYYYLFGIHVKKPKQKIQSILDYKKEIPIVVMQGAAMFIKKSVWDELGGFDDSQKFNLDDDDLSTRAMIYGYKNYLYNKSYIIHLGLKKRASAERYVFNDKTYFSGKSKVIWKNFSILTILWMWFFSSGRIVAESIYHSFTLGSIKIFFANIYSVYVFFKDLPDTLEKRKIIQKNRKVQDRDILRLKTPKYESTRS